MASIYSTSTGFRAQVFVHGKRKTKVFRTKREAVAWAAATETSLREVAARGEQHTLAEAIDRYLEEVTPTHRGQRWETLRLSKFRTELPATRFLSDFTPNDIALWRDRRGKSVAPGTVLREMKILGALFETARRDWGWVSSNPCSDVRKPRAPDHRTRTITRGEIRAMLTAMGYRPRAKVTSVSQAAAVAFLLALRTGMRAGELMGLTWDRVHPRFCRLTATKTTPRDVPLSRKASALLDRMRGWDEVLVFGMGVSTLDALFRRYRQRAGLSGFTFHDSRHTAATWAARRLDVLDLCKAFGWANPKQAMVYYNPSAADIASRLD
jgi:integrase